MSENESPPTMHILRPHHLDLLTIFVLVFREFELRPLPPLFLLHVYRLLLNEISEVAQPKTRNQLCFALTAGPKSDEGEAKNFVSGFKIAFRNLSTTEQVTSFFESIPSLYSDEDSSTLMRRSIFGYFCRRCQVSFSKLSYSGVVKLTGDYKTWCSGLGNYRSGYGMIMKDQMDDASLFLYKTHGDHKTWAQPEAFETWQKGQITGDENIAIENLRRFFEQYFHENNDSGIRQQALLNLVRMHYTRNEITAARQILSEAINTSRTSGDKLTLQHCISMLHRLPPVQGQKPALNEIQPDLEPLEVLFDVGKLLDESNEQPISAAFVKIAQAIGLYDYWVSSHATTPLDHQQWAVHTVQAITWEAAGCHELARTEENIAIAFTDIGGDDNNRITAILNLAYKRARNGQYEDSLIMLLDPDVWRGVTLDDYISWAQEIWHILVLRATRRGQGRLYREYLLPRRPPGEYNFRYYLLKDSANFQEPDGKIAKPLYEFIQMRECDQAAHAIDQLLTALWHSEFLFRLSFYRTAIILLADVGLEFGMSKRCRRILEEIMPQVITGGDREQRALACFTLARCLIATEGSTDDVLNYLAISEKDFLHLEMYTSLMDVQYLTSVVYNTLDMEKKRDEAAERYLATRAKRNELESVVIDEEARQILDIVAIAGAGLACRT